MDRKYRIVYWLAALLYAICLGITLLSLKALPPQVACHFNQAGQPDNWTSAQVVAGVFCGVYTVMFLVFTVLPRFAGKLPARWISVPHAEYWLSECRRPSLDRKMQRLAAEMGVGILAFLLSVELLTIRANLSEPVQLNQNLFYLVLGLFILFLTFWLTRLFRSFEVPAKAGRESGDD